jgi:hypothetical protein
MSECLAAHGGGQAPGMFIWSKTPGERPRTRFLVWPLVLSLLLSVVLTVVLNAVI